MIAEEERPWQGVDGRRAVLYAKQLVSGLPGKGSMDPGTVQGTLLKLSGGKESVQSGVASVELPRGKAGSQGNAKIWQEIVIFKKMPSFLP